MRMCRTHYLLWYVAINIFGSLLLSVAANTGHVGGTLLGLMILVLGQICVACCRLQDMNVNPWWSLAAVLPLVGFILVFPKGTEGENEYGDDPRPVSEKQQKINDLIENLSYELLPDTGKVEQIIFYLEAENERLFYDAPPEYIGNKFKKKIEQNIALIAKEKSADIYGMDYAIRAFYIGEQRILTWTKSN